MDIESRMGKLEEFAVETRERLTRIETRLEQTATKADLAELTATMIKWIVGIAFGMSAAGITVMSFVLNNATPKAAPCQHQWASALSCLGPDQPAVAFVTRSWQHAPIPKEMPCKSTAPNNPSPLPL